MMLLPYPHHPWSTETFSTVPLRGAPSRRLSLLIVAAKQTDQISPSSSQNASFLSVLCPLLKLFAGSDPSRPRNALLESATSGASSLARLPWGSRVSPDISVLSRNRGVLQPIQLYEFEACPFCRRVREAMTELDLPVEVYPCPKGSIHHRQIVKNTGGKEQFPFLIDSNTGICLYESGDIVKYLFKTYGGGKDPSNWLLESTLVTGWMPTLLRAGRGMSRWEGAAVDNPENKLVLFSYENNQYARIVREALCELELPYILYNVGSGTVNFSKLEEFSGLKEADVPLLIDPNTGANLSNYDSIIQYLFKNYSLSGHVLST